MEGADRHEHHVRSSLEQIFTPAPVNADLGRFECLWRGKTARTRRRPMLRIKLRVRPRMRHFASARWTPGNSTAAPAAEVHFTTESTLTPPQLAQRSHPPSSHSALIRCTGYFPQRDCGPRRARRAEGRETNVGSAKGTASALTRVRVHKRSDFDTRAHSLANVSRRRSFRHSCAPCAQVIDFDLGLTGAATISQTARHCWHIALSLAPAPATDCDDEIERDCARQCAVPPSADLCRAGRCGLDRARGQQRPQGVVMPVCNTSFWIQRRHAPPASCNDAACRLNAGRIGCTANSACRG